MTTANRGWTFALMLVLAQFQPLSADDSQYIVEPPDVLKLEVFGAPQGAAPLPARVLVQPDGRIGLGVYGSPGVAGMTVDEARAGIARTVRQHLGGEPVVRLEVAERRSKVYYIVSTEPNAKKIYRFPIEGGETVAGAILRVEGMAAVAVEGGLRVARPGDGVSVLSVDWQAITQQGQLATNHRLHAGDRVYVGRESGATGR